MKASFPNFPLPALPEECINRSAERHRDLLLEKWRKKMRTGTLADKTIQGAERPVVIGVHMRRTSHIRHMKVLYGSKVMEPIFFHDAFAFARKRHGKVAFIVVSDDLPWCRENVIRHHPDAVALDEPISRDEDFALMALSDHLIFGLGTFALFGGLLAKGDIIYATNVSYDLTRHYQAETRVSEARHKNLIPFHYRKPY
ncbi:galactoside alpha-(1,2)-fucosyltransferase 2-like [Oratosquilla oratoria]|uniref:galactoside alpha-(1,2)-fucosyltransferase 2-like n=1 Tax=Oratosquilla oratoria TaxID=337810 RepID=UPI003F75F398